MEESFGAWLKRRRKDLDLTQRDLAGRTGYSVETIVKIESGERRASREAAARLADCLGIGPDARPAFLHFARSAPPADRPPFLPPAPSAPSPPHHLPAPPNSFVGRRQDVQQLGEMLRRPEVRLLTLLGPPGIGKTRLALRVADTLRGVFAHGIYFVPLAALREAAGVLPAVAAALGVRESGRGTLAAALTNYLRDKELLLVLDNLEQLAGAGVVPSALLAAAPRLKVLATSRVPLRLYGEHEIRLAPLALPPRRLPTAATVGGADAVRLFVERAATVRPDFALTDSNAAAVAAICRRLEGLPLALELAAARSRTLDPAGLAARLADPAGTLLGVLTGGPRDLPARQRTVRAAIAWSYSLLSPTERRLLAQLAVFASGATPAAVAAVVGADATALPALLDNSLLRREQSGDETRYVLLETVREFALEQLPPPAAAAARDRHAQAYLALAEEAAPALLGPEQTAWLERLERDHANLRAALIWAGDQHDGPLALRLAAALASFWFRRGYLGEARAELRAVLAWAGDSPARARTRVFYWTGRAEWRAGDRAAAAALFSAGLALAHAAGDAPGAALALDGLGILAGDAGDLPLERTRYEESLAFWQAAGDRWGEAQTLHHLSFNAAAGGDFATARALQERSLALYRALGDLRGVAATLSGLGPAALGQDDYTTARAVYTESLALFRALGDKPGVAGALVGLGEVARCEQDYPAAQAAIAASLDLWRELGDREGMAMPLHNLAHVFLRLGDGAEAGRLFRESLDLFRALGVPVGLGLCLAGLGGVARLAGHPLRATRLLGAAAAALAAIGAHLQAADLADYEHNLTHLRRQLDEATLTAALAAGQAMTPDEAVSYMLDETTTGFRGRGT